ncbi:hypothetical protein [Sulfurimonas sp.]|jgi:hypothetical protein|uniref:hypothetical protein n=1 Tax=Sulfurimonas sp. TaxID=2022749 RepID=UPI0025E6D196|nr:hypothetical protein [Sulfurimonas sp.]MBT5935084.1 hypothetical protein [Sulfurimonas sp.]
MPPSKTLQKFLCTHNLEIRNSSKNYIINKYFETKEIKQSRDYDVSFVEIGNTNNLSGYILIKHNIESQSISKNRKKRKDFYCEVIFTGLRQPTKYISIDTYSILSLFINRFKISDMDICFDGINELEINQNALNSYYWLFKDYISSFNDALIEKTSFYINKPQYVEGDTSTIKKVILYDKYLKETRHKTLNSAHKHWKRLEATIAMQYKLKGLMIDDYIVDVLNISSKYFQFNDFNLDYIYMQLKLLLDRRTHKGAKSL